MLQVTRPSGEPGKQKPRSCRAQELARSSAQENARQKKALAEISPHLNERQIGRRKEAGSSGTASRDSLFVRHAVSY